MTLATHCIQQGATQWDVQRQLFPCLQLLRASQQFHLTLIGLNLQILLGEHVFLAQYRARLFDVS